ncbi:phosphoribosylformylglycinamidine synthase subunit PurL [Halanaeroarchaeum sulfurireducens]|uniref:Phosphoribosylformylglycinamidine synthase subunit PurL n=1 Tax=Halanaeroarchaeum sulfurireducens TaxID=1604004 RepID=A0A0F7PC88_9EURY|nr:phosphoribosylformylglycinamidine synthase subunit PurL [Halanaeroarchaeum sulfurireducens]AKH97805.1 phosphoribosylformylglycinamidine synthase [Halanaeroarchaeum sulfurireducens]ALG82199.1 phosphoribosylformylglycinamidine synthase [Halanaeroarchaeum sulfurireducens]
MSLPDSDRDLVVDALEREPTTAEAALFENLWSEHCAYRSSRPLLSAFDSEGEQVVVGPGDDAAVVAVDEDTYVAIGIESHNHPSYVDPYDGAATGVGGIVRDILSMGAYPIALTDSIYFGEFEREHSRYLLDGVVEGIGDYGNSIGVPTVRGSTQFHEKYEGNPLVNVSCVGLVDDERLVTADAKEPGNRLVLLGNATGRDGLGGASFASEDLSEDAETEDRPAVQVGDPYTEKLLIEANEELVEADLVEAARDLGAAGLGGATSEMVAKGDLGARIDLDAVHLRETGMNATEIVLAESQERMAYEVRPENVEAVADVADHYDLGFSVIGEVTDTGRYVCEFEGDTVVDVPAIFVADGAPMNDLPAVEPTEPERSLPEAEVEAAFEAVVASPNTASKRWVYRQYDHEVGVRTALRPGDDVALLALRDVGKGLAISAGANPGWTETAPYDGARAVAIENATNIAAKGATPLAAVDCLNGGNPEKPDVYGDFVAMVDGLADACSTLDVPVVGGNVSLYNDSAAGPIPPTPTLSMIGVKDGYDAPPLSLDGGKSLVLVGEHASAVGGSEYLAQMGGTDRFPSLPENPREFVETLATVANDPTTTAVHDVSDGGLAVTLAEMVTAEAGADVAVPDRLALFSEAPGRAVVETSEPRSVAETFEEVAPVVVLGSSTNDGLLRVDVEDHPNVEYDASEIVALRETIEAAMD